MVKVGITGGIGSGKTTVCRMLEEAGVPVLYADAIAIEIEQSDPAIRKALTELLGKEAFHENGTVNRPYLASKIFSSKKLHKAVEQIVHPAVMQEIDRRMRKYSESGTPVVAVEAALLYESGMHKQLDAIVVVDARENLRIRRVVDRDQVKAEAVRKRMAAQWSVERKIRSAHVVLGNNGTMEELRVKVGFLLTLFTTLSKGSTHAVSL